MKIKEETKQKASHTGQPHYPGHIMYIAPRYHTNQVPIVRALLEKGIKVTFLSQYMGPTENYQDLRPIVIGFSGLYNFFAKIITKLFHLDNKAVIEMNLKIGIPPKGAIERQIQEKKPDLVIARERNIYSMVAYRACKKSSIDIILYNQSPYYLDCIKNDIMHKIVRGLTPKRRMTPVIGNKGSASIVEPFSQYVPFVMQPHFYPSEREWFKDGALHIFTVGKYEEGKNHLMLIQTVKRLCKEYKERPISLTITGECRTKEQKSYYDLLEKSIEKAPVRLLKNQTAEEMDLLYKGTDLFVLAGTSEKASISQLEAMSYGLPIICSDTNGCAYHVISGVNGELFTDNDPESLYRALLDVISRNLKEYGQASIKLVEENYNIDKYLDGIMSMIG